MPPLCRKAKQQSHRNREKQQSDEQLEIIRRRCQTKKIKPCPFELRIQWCPKRLRWVIARYRRMHQGHYPRLHLQSLISPAEKKEIQEQRFEHGTPVSVLLSILRSKGIITTTRDIHNVLNSFTKSSPTGSQSEELLQAIGEDTDTVAVLRLEILDDNDEILSHVDLLRLPDRACMIPLGTGVLV